MQDNINSDEEQIDSINNFFSELDNNVWTDFQFDITNQMLFYEAFDLFKLGYYKKAFKIFNSLSNAQYVPGMVFVAGMYEEGIYVQKNYQKAKNLYEKALTISPNYDRALLGLGALYYYGKGVPTDFKKAFELIQKSANNGNMVAEYSMGTIYLKGAGVEQDYKKALEWFLKSAEKNYPSAQNDIGYMYAKGLYVDVDDEQAVSWWQIAAENGHPIAQNNLGYRYSIGKGIEANPELSMKWCRKSAEQGYASAQYNVGLELLQDNPTEEDKKEAFKWFTLCAEQNLPKGQLFLGYMHQRGFSVPVDFKKAKELYEKAAAQGDEDAINQLKYLEKKMANNPQPETSNNAQTRNNIIFIIFFIIFMSTLWTIGKTYDKKKAEEEYNKQIEESFKNSSEKYKQLLDEHYKQNPN